MAFNTDIFSNCDGLFFCVASWSNDVTLGYFWSIILLAFGIVVFMGTLGFGTKKSYGYSGISMGFIGIVLVQLSLIPLWFLTIILINSIIGIAVMLIGDK